jgi:hypothetical protein
MLAPDMEGIGVRTPTKVVNVERPSRPRAQPVSLSDTDHAI